MRVAVSVVLTALWGSAAAAQAGGAPPSWRDVSSAVVTGVAEEGPVELEGGRWEGPPFVAGGASAPAVWLSPEEDFYLVGDLDADGRPEAVVHLVYGTGGTGSFGYLAVFSRGGGGGVVQRAVGGLGDRVQIRDAGISGRTVRVETLQHGPQDGMCCPSRLVSRSFRMTERGLVEAPAVDEGAASAATLDGTRWRLDGPGVAGEAAPDEAVSLEIAGGVVSGFAGCNRYRGPLRDGDTPTGVVIGPLAATRKACAPDVMASERAFTGRLQAAAFFGFHHGRLQLTYNEGEQWGTLRFRPVPGAPSGSQ